MRDRGLELGIHQGKRSRPGMATTRNRAHLLFVEHIEWVYTLITGDWMGQLKGKSNAL